MKNHILDDYIIIRDKLKYELNIIQNYNIQILSCKWCYYDNDLHWDYDNKDDEFLKFNNIHQMELIKTDFKYSIFFDWKVREYVACLIEMEIKY